MGYIKSIKKIQDANEMLKRYPVLVKNVHIINCRAILTFFLNGFLFCNKKTQSRFKVHSCLKSLNNDLDISLLPTEYGGTAGDLADLWAKDKEILSESRFLIKDKNDFKSICK